MSAFAVLHVMPCWSSVTTGSPTIHVAFAPYFVKGVRNNKAAPGAPAIGKQFKVCRPA